MPSTKYRENNWSDILTEAISRRDDAKRVRSLARKNRDAKEFLVRVSGPATFRCPLCKRSGWASKWGMVTLNMKKESLAKAWKQGCSKCADRNAAAVAALVSGDEASSSEVSICGGGYDCRTDGAKPRFRPNEMQQMAEQAVEKFLRKLEQGAAPPPRTKNKAPKNTKPHRKDLCEACALGKCLRR